MPHNVFSAKSSRVVRILLTRPGKAWALRQLGLESGVSLGTVHYVTSALVQMRLAGRDESNMLVLTDPYRLIRQWAASYNYLFSGKSSEYYTFDSEFEVFLSRFSKLPHQFRDKYALTLYAAAWIVAPYVRPTDFHIYLRPDIKKKDFAEFIRDLDISPAEKSGNVKLVTPYDEGVFADCRLIDGVRVVSPVQLYVDLFNYPGRGEEAATKVLEMITSEWRAEEVVRR